MFLRKKSRQVFPLKVRGRATIDRYSKGGIYLGTIGPVKNTLTSDFFDEFLRLIAGTSSKDYGSNGPHLDSTQASVGINNSTSAGSFVFEQIGTDAGPSGTTVTKASPSSAMTWEWHDISTNTYSNANYLHFYYGDPSGGGAGGEYRIAYVNIAAGNKPNDENWYYKFTLELYSTDTDFTDGGFDLLMELYTGDSARHLDSSGIRLRPTSGAGTGSEVSGSDQAPDGNPTVDTSNDDIEWTWTVSDGDFEGTWGGTKVKVGTSFAIDLRWGGCKTNGDSCGTKASGEEWTYTYTLAISQGS